MDYRDEMDCRRNPRYIVRAWALGTALYITSLTRLESYFQDNDPAAQVIKAQIRAVHGRTLHLISPSRAHTHAAPNHQYYRSHRHH